MGKNFRPWAPVGSRVSGEAVLESTRSGVKTPGSYSQLHYCQTVELGMKPQCLGTMPGTQEVLENFVEWISMRDFNVLVSSVWETVFHLFRLKQRKRRRQWHPVPVLLPGKSHGQRSLLCCSPGGTKSRTRLSDFTFTFHFHALEKEMATQSSVLAWRVPGTGEPGGLPSMGLHRVRHDWSDLAVAVRYPWFICTNFEFKH